MKETDQPVIDPDRHVSDAIEYLATLWSNEREQMVARNSMCALWVALTNRSVDDYNPPLDRLAVATWVDVLGCDHRPRLGVDVDPECARCRTMVSVRETLLRLRRPS